MQITLMYTSGVVHDYRIGQFRSEMAGRGVALQYGVSPFLWRRTVHRLMCHSWWGLTFVRQSRRSQLTLAPRFLDTLNLDTRLGTRRFCIRCSRHYLHHLRHPLLGEYARSFVLASK